MFNTKSRYKVKVHEYTKELLYALSIGVSYNQRVSISHECLVTPSYGVRCRYTYICIVYV